MPSFMDVAVHLLGEASSSPLVLQNKSRKWTNQRSSGDAEFKKWGEMSKFLLVLSGTSDTHMEGCLMSDPSALLGCRHPKDLRQDFSIF